MRKLTALLLAVALLLAFGATASAATTTVAATDDAKFIKQLKKLDDYLMTNHYSGSVGDYAVDYMANSSDFKDFDIERLAKLLTTWLSCNNTVRLTTKLTAYAKDLGGGYMSLSGLCNYYTTPEKAADAGNYIRKNEGASLQQAVSSTPRYTTSCTTCTPCTRTCP